MIEAKQRLQDQTLETLRQDLKVVLQSLRNIRV